MNQSDFAKLHSVSRKTVTTWKARGWLVLAGDDIDVEASNANIERYRKTVTRPEKKTAGNTQGNKQGNKSGNNRKGNRSGNKHDADREESPAQIAARLVAEMGATMSMDEARTLKENFFALLAKLEYEEKSGQLLPYKNMIEAVGMEYSRMRTRLIAIAPEHGPRLRVLASTTDDAGFVAALQEVVYEAMEELSLDTNNDRGDS
ncbi:RNA polymerase subunit sigma-70 [Sodalis ligni]|uniref:RNA polymerase subunit sigma-70 n=1 Tax=Sodalis ligni TaxID=2697027 RepID=UPI00193FC739|nr:RNA polymerase subunit sigma-70 [Sodalis ligni]QWA09801.1 RNA polymerase subunit sigma-70 [Sodalis ligni]